MGKRFQVKKFPRKFPQKILKKIHPKNFIQQVYIPQVYIPQAYIDTIGIHTIGLHTISINTIGIHTIGIQGNPRKPKKQTPSKAKSQWSHFHVPNLGFQKLRSFACQHANGELKNTQFQDFETTFKEQSKLHKSRTSFRKHLLA